MLAGTLERRCVFSQVFSIFVHELFSLSENEIIKYHPLSSVELHPVSGAHVNKHTLGSNPSVPVYGVQVSWSCSFSKESE